MRQLFHACYYWANVFTWIRLLVGINVRRQVMGLEKVPLKGPLILASNHLSVADPSILTAIMPRRIVWMTKRELFDIPLYGIVYHLFGAIPVRRFEADLGALRRAQETLRRGLALGMFPEGTRSLTGGLSKGYPGTALIALRTGAPILPIAFWGTEKITLPRAFFQRTPAWLAFGDPFYLPQAERLTTPVVEEGTELIMTKIAELLPPQYRGVYSDTVAAKASTQGVSSD